MRRREFLGAASGALAGLMAPRVAVSATPCAPQLTGEGSKPSSPCISTSGMSLAEAAASLAPGQSIQFTKNTIQHEADIQWQLQTIWYDPNRGELQYMGKPASSQSENYSHYIYKESTDTWYTSGQSLFPGLGHIWNVTFDPVNGDYWFRKYGENVLRWFDRSDGSTGSWNQTVAQTSPALNAGNANFAAMGWHPNLFGVGRPGIFIWAVFRFFAYDLSTKEFHSLSKSDFPGSSIFWNRSVGQALYLPASDRLICFASDAGNGHEALLVNAGAGNSSDVVGEGFVEVTSAPPIPVYGAGGSTLHGHVVAHPEDPNRLLLLEEHGSSRIWHSTDLGKTWQLQVSVHPFQLMENWSQGEYTVGSIPKYGVIVGMTSNADGGETVLWKPEI